MTLKEVIALTFAYYNQGKDPLQDQVLLMYAQDLEDLPEEKCIVAYQNWRRNPANKGFPLPAHIREIVSPGDFISNELEAREIASRIVGAVTKYGWNNARDAESFIGPVGWSVVQKQGGWSHLCENMGTRISATTFQAQIRDLLEGTLKHGAPAIEAKIKLQPKRDGNLIQANFARLLGEREEEET